MDDDDIIRKGGDENDIASYAERNGASYPREKHHYSHFSWGHARVGDRIVIFGLTHLEYFDLKKKKIFKYGKFQKGKRGKSI